MCGKSGDIACTLGLPATALAIICDWPLRGRKPLENRFSNTRIGLARTCARGEPVCCVADRIRRGRWRMGDPARLRCPDNVLQEPGLLLPYSSGHVL
ncbi:hypothetical protein G0D91_15095 [Burkholderia multivorans]|nr:hypothetical protein [Burkholderia multivorans]MBN8163846.1 hypothetical protein [Burkholderia multivorans]MBN8168756.1 hypothetical protein [Burkholderia multivorans]MBN8174648.1 hypothetical protein [Burkholderia multivorans]QSL26511.1 hypothetical protein G0D92_15455 [Burkholderia multivorans]